MQAARGGGGYFRLLPYWLTRGLGVDQPERSRPFIFYLHPWEIDPDQPRVAASLAVAVSPHYTGLLGKCEARLQRLLGDFRFGTVRDGLEKLGLLPSSAPTR